ncbi:MAG: hypothetical protein LAO31_17320 [Acidobacteriia bacterium]|nr:hypothetical protein [Terriglobia bacterium]
MPSKLPGGDYYETNQYGATLLRAAVKCGYQQGFLAAPICLLRIVAA